MSEVANQTGAFLHLHERDVRISQGFQSPASIMIVEPLYIWVKRDNVIQT